VRGGFIDKDWIRRGRFDERRMTLQ
jgi:hypothetical protein